MEFSEVLRERKSTRQYGDPVLENRLVEEIVQEASWAPSAGNTQPWRVVVLCGKPLREFLNRFEKNCLEMLLPGAKLAILESATRENRRLEPASLNRQIADTLPLFEMSISPPSQLLLVCYEERGLIEKLRELIHSVSIVSFRLRQKKGWWARLRYLWLMLAGCFRLFATARSVRMASLSNYTYGLTLCARSRGVESCIVGSLCLAGAAAKRFVGLAGNEQIAAVVALGRTLADAVEPAPRTRRPVAIRWIADR